jgi:hypothetical protein
MAPRIPFFLALTAGCQVNIGNEPSDGEVPSPPVEADEPERLCTVELTCGGDILDEPKTPCTVAISDADGVVMYNGQAGVEKRGRSSLYFPKPQYAVELREYSELPMWPGSTWKYLDDGSDPGIAWRQPDFNDASWSEGGAQLGFGADYLVTEVQPATTVYLRASFTPASRAAIENLRLGILRDDGAAVYLNGVQVLRDNLPTGLAFDTWADAPTTFEESVRWVSVDVDPGLLADGENVLAVEVHQAEESASNMRFDLYVEASGKNAPVSLLSMGKEEDWILNGQYVDRVLWRNRLVYDLFQDLGGPERYATETRFCEMTLNGAYEGIYTLGERIEEDDDRVVLSEDGNPGDRFIVKLEEGEGFVPSEVSYGTWAIVWPEEDPDAEAPVAAYLGDWAAAVNGGDPSQVFDYVDRDSAVDWVLVNELAKNHDAYFLSVVLWKDRDGKMFFTPWDLDLSMGYPYTDCGATGWNPRTWAALDGTVVDIPFIQAMAADAGFHQALVDRWHELRAGPWSDQAILDHIAAYDATLEPALASNLDRWPIDDIAFTTLEVEDWLCPVSSYDDEHQRTLDFLTARLAWMDGNIATF